MRLTLPVILLVFGFILLVFEFIACSQPSPTQEYMIISPDTLRFASGVSSQTISITHSCTCPFSWQSQIISNPIIGFDTSINKDTIIGYDTVANWLDFPKDTTGDWKSISVSTVPSNYFKAIDTGRVVIVSNSYGTDTIVVIATR